MFTEADEEESSRPEWLCQDAAEALTVTNMLAQLQPGFRHVQCTRVRAACVLAYCSA